MHPDVDAILRRVKDTADFGYVDFTDINATNALGCNALHCVIVWGDYEAAKTLIAHGINVNQSGEEGYTPLHEACSFGHTDIVRLLLDSGADLDARTAGDLPFTTARLNGHDAICDLLASRSFTTHDPWLLRHERHISKLRNSLDGEREENT